MIKAFIFDVDGTLVDTTKLHIKSWQRAFKKFGLDIPVGKIQSQIGRRATEIARSLVPKGREEDIEPIVEGKKLIFREYYPEIKPFPKVKELFELLDKKGIKIALATSTTRRDAEFYVGLLLVKGLIGALVTAEDIHHSKPNPEIFLKAAEQLGANPEDSAVVGDSSHDMAAAKNAGMLAIGILTGGYPKEELLVSGADKIFQNIAEIYNNIEKILR